MITIVYLKLYKKNIFGENIHKFLMMSFVIWINMSFKSIDWQYLGVITSNIKHMLKHGQYIINVIVFIKVKGF